MKRIALPAACLLMAVVMAGCASGTVEGSRSYMAGEYIARPGRIIVYDFAATADDLAPSSAITGRYVAPGTPYSPEEVRLGRELGRRVADKLVKDILAMGLPAERARTGPPASVGSIVVTGEFVTIDEGDRAKRMVVGFGAGAAEVKMVVEAYHITANGPRLMGSRAIRAEGGKAPGMAAPLIIAGGIFGRPVTAAAVSGGLNIAQELGPEKIQSVADRAAEAVSKEIEKGARRRGWI